MLAPFLTRTEGYPMGNTPTLQDAAKEILRIAVREQKTQTDQPIDSGPV